MNEMARARKTGRQRMARSLSGVIPTSIFSRNAKNGEDMKIYVNDKPHDFGGVTVADLVAQLSLPSDGVAVAIGMSIVPRAEWALKALSEGDKVMIIKAASGG